MLFFGRKKNMNCKNCGAAIQNTDSICCECGTEIKDRQTKTVKCCECGKFFNEKFGICPFCGADIEKSSIFEETETQNKYTAVKEKANEIKTEYCRFCGKTIVENSQFCAYCGKELREDFANSTKTSAKDIVNIKSEIFRTNTMRIKIKILTLITMLFNIICGCIVLFGNWFSIRPISQLLYGNGGSYGHYGLFDITKLGENLAYEVEDVPTEMLGFACILAIVIAVLTFVSIVKCIGLVLRKNEECYIKGKITSAAGFSISVFISTFIQVLILNSFVSSVNEIFNDIDGYRIEIISLENAVSWLFVLTIIGFIVACILAASEKKDTTVIKSPETDDTESENDIEKITNNWMKQNSVLHEENKDTWMCPVCARILPNDISTCSCGYDKYGTLKV